MSANSKKGLGRGFDSLIPADLIDESFDPTALQDKSVSQLKEIELDKISADPDQPRRQIEQSALEELAASIKEHGVLQPIVVTPAGSGYQIVAGERRYRASQLAGLTKIPALVRTLSDQHKLEISLIENLQREDLNVIETAMAYLKLRDQFNLNLEQIGQRVGNRSMSAISNTIRLLKLPASVRQALADGKLREGQARPLIGLDEDTINKLVPRIISEEWSSRKVEQFLVNLKTSGETMNTIVDSQPYRSEVETMQTRLGMKIGLQTNARGAGRLTITFKDSKEFDKLFRLINDN